MTCSRPARSGDPVGEEREILVGRQSRDALRVRDEVGEAVAADGADFSSSRSRDACILRAEPNAIARTARQRTTRTSR